MRNLKLLAAAAIAAMALMAGAAAPAQADDLPFYVNDQEGLPCSPCYDTDTIGQIEIWQGTWKRSTCEVRFDVEINNNGSFETDNTQVLNGCPSLPLPLYPCDDSWTGQIRVPETGPAKADLEICLRAYPGNETTHNVTFNLGETNGERTWTQSSTDTHQLYQFKNGAFVGYDNSDDFQIEIFEEE